LPIKLMTLYHFCSCCSFCGSEARQDCNCGKGWSWLLYH